MPRRTVKPTVPLNVPAPTGQAGPNLDINQIMQSAQQIAKNISAEDRDKINNMDVNQMFDHVAGAVFNTLEKGGKQIDPASKQQMKVMSKVMLSEVMENIESDHSSR